MSRVSTLLVVLASSFTVQPSWAGQPDFRLRVVPAIVYKVDDPGSTGTSSFLFDIAVTCSSDCAISPISGRVELSNEGSIVERQEWTTEQLAKIKGENYRISQDTPAASPKRVLTLHFTSAVPRRWPSTRQMCG